MGPGSFNKGELSSISNRSKDQETKKLIQIISKLSTDHEKLENAHSEKLEKKIAEIPNG